MLDEVRDLRKVGEAFLEALANRDFEALRACLQQDVSFRALVPSGIRQATDASGTVNRLRLWFGEADSFKMLRSEVGQVADRLSITYRIRLHDSDGWQVIEQLRQDERLADVPVVVITAFNRDLGSAAKFPLLRKPIELGDLLDVTHSYGCAG